MSAKWKRSPGCGWASVDKHGCPAAWDLEIAPENGSRREIWITVARHPDWPGDWVVRCDAVGFANHFPCLGLGLSLEDAQRDALSLCREAARRNAQAFKVS